MRKARGRKTFMRIQKQLIPEELFERSRQGKERSLEQLEPLLCTCKAPSGEVPEGRNVGTSLPTCRIVLERQTNRFRNYPSNEEGKPLSGVAGVLL
jgi:hypothetical protein